MFAIQAKPTASFAEVQTALDGWKPATTNDVPEGQLFALYELGEMLGTDGWSATGTGWVYDDAKWTETLETVDKTSPYALTGAIFANDRAAVREASMALRNAAGNKRVLGIP